jgi:hypothetical protein
MSQLQPILTLAQFLGVLLALIILAAALTLRSYRMRARYRTQTQLAIARGDAPTGSWWGDDVWGIPWVGWAPVRSSRERRWMPIPVLYDAVPEPEKDLEIKGKGMETELWDDIQVSLSSRYSRLSPCVEGFHAQQAGAMWLGGTVGYAGDGVVVADAAKHPDRS